MCQGLIPGWHDGGTSAQQSSNTTQVESQEQVGGDPLQRPLVQHPPVYPAAVHVPMSINNTNHNDKLVDNTLQTQNMENNS